MCAASSLVFLVSPLPSTPSFFAKQGLNSSLIEAVHAPDAIKHILCAKVSRAPRMPRAGNAAPAAALCARVSCVSLVPFSPPIPLGQLAQQVPRPGRKQPAFQGDLRGWCVSSAHCRRCLASGTLLSSHTSSFCASPGALFPSSCLVGVHDFILGTSSYRVQHSQDRSSTSVCFARRCKLVSHRSAQRPLIHALFACLISLLALDKRQANPAGTLPAPKRQ